MTETCLCHLVNPISILVEVIPSIWVSRIIVDFHDVTGSTAQTWVEVRLLQEHGELITIKEMVALRLSCASDTIAVCHTGFTAHTTLCLDFDYTISTLRTPDSCSGSIFQYTDILNILWVYIKQLCELLVVCGRQIKILAEVVFPYVTVNYDKRISITVDRANTTKTHRCTRTEVT